MRALVVATLAVFSGCAHHPQNKPLNKIDSSAGYRFKNLSKDDNSDSLQIFIAMSGGGMRATALSYGVLEELARTEIVWEGQKKRMLDEVDYISAVSGGSFTAAYYALHHDRIFKDFEKDFLNRNVQADLVWRLASPKNWVRLSSPAFNRSDMAAEYYDERIFRGATYGDLLKQRRKPFLALNATDMSLGSSFQFTQEHFDFLGSDITCFPIARAVAASSAFPILLSPITLNNYAGTVDCTRPEWMKAALTNRLERSRRSIRARELESYQNVSNHPYLHLLDGGLSDNLGLRGPFEDIALKGGMWEKIDGELDPSTMRKLAIIVVNSATRRDKGWDRRQYPPSAVQVTVALGTVPMNRYSFDTMELLKQSIAEWQQDWNFHNASLGNRADSPGGTFKIYLIEVTLDLLPDQTERGCLEELPTSFSLPRDATKRLRIAGGTLLRESKDFKELIEDIRAGR